MKTITFLLVKTICCCTWLQVCNGLLYDEAKVIYTALYSDYTFGVNGVYDSVVPQLGSSQPLDVNLEMKLYSLSGIDAVAGSIQLIAALKMEWQDNTISTGDPGNTLHVDYRRLWTPVIVLMNSADSIKRVGDETYKVRYNPTTATVTWQPRLIVDAACNTNVQFFPFDQQECSLTFIPWFQDKNKITLHVLSNEWDLLDYSVNGVWTIEKTWSTTGSVGNFSSAVFTITVNRVPLYFLINIVFPILCLSLLTGMVFLLPAASGERVGFCITCFLSFVVLLQTLMQYLPRTSSPMSLLCYYVVVMMMFSAVVSIVTILLLRLYSKPKNEPMPAWLKTVVETLNCTKCKRMCQNSVRPTFKSKKIPEETSKNGVTTIEIRSVTSGDELGEERPKPEVTNEANWDDLARILDFFFFLVFIGVQSAISLFFLVPIGTRL